MSHTISPADSKLPSRHRSLTQIAIFFALIALAAIGEALRWSNEEQRALALTHWLCGPQADWLPFLPWLIAVPLFWRMRSSARQAAPADDAARGKPARSSWRVRMLALLVAGLSFAINAETGRRFGDLPPAYHDEFSYVFQAKTFLAGRLWFPSFEPMPELFDQMHVLNEGRFASRYFPGTGLWMAPFVALGNPWLGHWLAGALATLFVFWIGWEIGGLSVAVTASLLSALAPGLILFSNLLLAHQPTLAGLTLFIWMYLRADRSGSLLDSALGSAGLTYAMLCRPMTAFGVGLPFGLLLGWKLLSGRISTRAHSAEAGQVAAAPWTARLGIIAAWGLPLATGLGAMLAYNAAITGSAWTSPYQLYTDTYTPRHVFGFYNVSRGERKLGPKVLENYDRWAEELTPQLAARNVARRLVTSLRWTLGIVPIVGAVLVLPLFRVPGGRGTGLIAAAIASLHAVHVPYWFEGIMGWHYVFESAPLWLLLLGEATRRMWTIWIQTGHSALRWWWGGILATAVCVNLVPIAPLWPGRLAAGMSEVAFSRQRYAAFFDAAQQLAQSGPIVIFVEPDPADRHMDYVVNDPALDGPVLIARYRPGRIDLERARRLFPDRTAYLYRAASREWRRLDGRTTGAR